MQNIIKKIFDYKRPLTGMEITEKKIKIVSMEKVEGNWLLSSWGEAFFPAETIKFSYKSPNIINSENFKQTIKDAVQSAECDISYIGLSLPNEIIKVFIQEFDELPESAFEAEKMISWWVQKNLRISQEDVKIDFYYLGNNQKGKKKVLITIGFIKVIQDYEKHLKELKIDAVNICPSGISQFNYYCRDLPLKGSMVYIGIFPSYFTFIAINNEELTFYHNVKTGPLDPYFLHHFEMAWEYFRENEPDKSIDSLWLGGIGKEHKFLQEQLSGIITDHVEIAGGSRIIKEKSFSASKEKKVLSNYCAAIGAALNLI